MPGRSAYESASDVESLDEQERDDEMMRAAVSAPTSPSHLQTSSAPNIEISAVAEDNSNGNGHQAPTPAPAAAGPPRPGVTPLGGATTSALGRFRASANKIIQMNRHASKFVIDHVGPGAEPGADPRRPSVHEQWAHIHENCSIQIVDYSDTKATFLRADNEGLIRFLTTREGDRPAWSKVRWINVGGISWDVISTLALEYDLHPLAVEDVLHSRRTSMSKADYYTKHLFISTLIHSLRKKPTSSTGASDLFADTTAQTSTVLPGMPRPLSSSPMPTMHANIHSTSELPPPVTQSNGNDASDPRPNWLKAHFSRSNGADHHHTMGHIEEDKTPIEEPDDKDGVAWIYESIEGAGNSSKGAKPAVAPVSRPQGSGVKAAKKAADMAFLEELKGDGRVLLDVSNLYIFLLRDGTVITIYKKTDDGKIFGAPILARLRSEHMIMRRSKDPSLLVEGLLDYVVDKALEVVDKYHDKILKLERSILIRPKMSTVHQMHILSGDLTLHKRTLAPIRVLIYGLRRYDLDRVKALVSSSDPSADPEKAKGYLSHQSKVYLADVNDHMDYILESMDMFGTISENLISYTFNSISYQTNEAMRRLSLATIIFFPLTFLTGYFGMNFHRFSATNMSDAFFWAIGIPLVFVFVLVWSWSDLSRIAHVIKKQTAEKQYQQARSFVAIAQPQESNPHMPASDVASLCA